MAYSFIERPAKSPFSPGIRKVWLGGAAVLLLAGVATALIHLYGKEIQSDTAVEKTVQETLKLQAEQIKIQQVRYELDKMKQQQSATANQLLADQLFDLLDLVPDSATLERFEFGPSGVVYEGVCRDFDALKTGLIRAFTGQYRLKDASAVKQAGSTKFRLRFASNGAVQ